MANPWSGGEAPDVQTLSLAGDVEQMAAHMDIDDPFTKAMPAHPNPITLTLTLTLSPYQPNPNPNPITLSA